MGSVAHSTGAVNVTVDRSGVIQHPFKNDSMYTYRSGHHGRKFPIYTSILSVT